MVRKNLTLVTEVRNYSVTMPRKRLYHNIHLDEGDVPEELSEHSDKELDPNPKDTVLPTDGNDSTVFHNLKFLVAAEIAKLVNMQQALTLLDEDDEQCRVLRAQLALTRVEISNLDRQVAQAKCCHLSVWQHYKKRVFQQESDTGSSAWEQLPVATTGTKRQATESFEEEKFNLLIPMKNRLWLHPRSRNVKNYATHLPKARIPPFEGNGGTVSASNWLIQMSIIFFRDCGVPVEVAVEEIGRGMPFESRAYSWHNDLLDDQPNITFDEFARLFVVEFSDTVDSSVTVNALLSFQQNDLDFEDFVIEHGRLFWKVHKHKTSMDQLLDWGTRLNALHQPMFKKFLANQSSDARLREYNTAIRWFRSKVQKLPPTLTVRGPTILAVTNSAPSPFQSKGVLKTVPCNLGCYKKAHPEGKQCPALSRLCKTCNVQGHFSRSPLCSGKPGVGSVVAAVAVVPAAAPVPAVAGNALVAVGAPQPLI